MRTTPNTNNIPEDTSPPGTPTIVLNDAHLRAAIDLLRDTRDDQSIEFIDHPGATTDDVMVYRTTLSGSGGHAVMSGNDWQLIDPAFEYHRSLQPLQIPVPRFSETNQLDDADCLYSELTLEWNDFHTEINLDDFDTYEEVINILFERAFQYFRATNVPPIKVDDNDSDSDIVINWGPFSYSRCWDDDFIENMNIALSDMINAINGASRV